MNTALLMYVLYSLKVRFNSYFITQDFSEQVPSPSEIEYTDGNGQDSLSLLDDKFKFAPSIVLILLYLFPCRHLLTFFSKSLSIWVLDSKVQYLHCCKKIFTQLNKIFHKDISGIFLLTFYYFTNTTIEIKDIKLTEQCIQQGLPSWGVQY
jgi:hypothetical protein